MKNTGNTISIDRNDLVARLNEAGKQADGDLARVIELLLLENHVLRRQQSTGLLRGLPVRYDDYPRFLKFDEPKTGESPDASGSASEMVNGNG